MGKVYAYYVVFSYDEGSKVKSGSGKENQVTHSNLGTKEILSDTPILAVDDVYRISEEIRRAGDLNRVTVINWREMSRPSLAATQGSSLTQTSDVDVSAQGSSSGDAELISTDIDVHQKSNIHEEDSSRSNTRQTLDVHYEVFFELLTGERIPYEVKPVRDTADQELFIHLNDGGMSGLFKVKDNQLYCVTEMGVLLETPVSIPEDTIIYSFGEIDDDILTFKIFRSVLNLLSKT